MRALRALDDPGRLARSPLLELCIVGTADAPRGSEARARALRALLLEHCAMFSRSPRDEQVWRVLRLTFLSGQTKQRAAAAAAHMPFGTYRRHLSDGLRRLADALWYREHEARARTTPSGPDWLRRRATEAEPPRALAHGTFVAEVRRALRRADRPDLLRESPLLDCAFVRQACRGAPPSERALCLQRLLREACESLRGGDPLDRAYRILERTYLRPAVKQLAAAQDLGMTFGTYRRHLARATSRVAEILWELESRAATGAGGAQ